MKLKSVSGMTIYVNDLPKTAKFYQDLGFTKVSADEKFARFRLKRFIIDFVAASKEEKEEFKEEASSQNKGAGVYFTISVDNVDETYEELIKKRFKPSTKPRDWPWGSREFVLRDPDRYKLVFSQKL